MAHVIILNGVSSSGKTTLARTLQNALAGDYLYVSMDSFMAMLPVGREMSPPWFIVEARDFAGSPLVSIRSDSKGERLLTQMRKLIADMAGNGFDVIVDEVCTSAEICDYRQRLSQHRLHIVKVTADLELIQTRERERGDRMPGLAREQWDRLHDAIHYDQIIDTTARSPSDCAADLLATMSRTNI